jgi:ABC-type phosphate/phosphonate transport system substrate-binding protein
MKRIIAIFWIFLLVVSCSTSPETEETSTTGEAAEEKPTYRIGYMICNSEPETLDRFLPLTAYLSQKLGVNFEAEAIDTIQFMKEVDGLDFTHTNSLLYIMMQRLKGVEILAAEKKGSLGHLSQGVIITKADSAIKTVADLKGKTMIFGPSLAPTGFMSQVDTLMQNGPLSMKKLPMRSCSTSMTPAPCPLMILKPWPRPAVLWTTILRLLEKVRAYPIVISALRKKLMRILPLNSRRSFWQ